jgi:hypothetical protein
MKNIIFIFILIFILNFIWEISQAFLYAPHYVGIAGLVAVHLRASLGDIFLVFLILMLDIFIFSKIFMEEKVKWIRITLMMLSGFVLAVVIEKYALATGRWSYNPLMPIIPGLNVGLTPILQMMLIPPVVAMAWSRLWKNAGY